MRDSRSVTTNAVKGIAIGNDATGTGRFKDAKKVCGSGVNMQTQLFSNDITIRKHKNNAASNDANVRANKTKPRDRMRVLDFAIRSGGRIWLKQVERELGMLRNTVSARLSEMTAMGMLQDTGEREEGCRILRLVIK